ncbi:MAG: TauD/TfdA dioxygenase family protein [Acidimicrobiales bacterium]
MSTVDATTLAFSPITPRFGAELGPVTLLDMSDDEVDALQQLAAERGVVVVRDQVMTAGEHARFAHRLGPLTVHQTGDSDLPPELLLVQTDENSKRAVGGAWHSDISSEQRPPALSMLRMEVVPSSGGDTLFADMYQAFEALSPEIQALVRRLTARHDSKGHHLYLRGIKTLKELPSHVHPVARTHPRTGRTALYVNSSFVARIMETNKLEGEAILRMLYDHVALGVDFHCRVQWKPNTVVFWDNRCVQHHGVFDYYPELRRGYRATSIGETPYLDT